jgi:LmbE family N-acetylglucosaminyl deacetylase
LTIVEPEQPDATGPLTILIVVAHPDDIDFGSGGSVATWTGEGHRVVYCLITDGDAGGYDEEITRADMAALRREEQTAAAAILGVDELHFLGWPDGRLYVTHELRRDLARVIRQVRPDRVVTQSPTRNLRSMYGSHPDHAAAGEATMCAVYPDARNPFAHPELLADEGLAAHTVSEVWISHMGEGADHYVDTTDAFDRKVEALRAHKSQTAHMDDLRGRMWGWGRSQAKAAGLEPERTAEGYVVLDTR